MKLWRLIAILLVAVMALSLFTGCKTTDNEEEAVAGEYIEGEEQQMSGSKPQKGEESEIITNDDNEDEPKDDEPKDEEPKDEDPKDEDPKDEDLKDEDPKDEDPKDEDPKDEDPKDEEPKDDGSGEDDPEDADKPNLEGTDPRNALKIVAYNLRVGNDGSGNNIADRNPRFKALVDEIQPDVLGLSECNTPWIEYLEKEVFNGKYAMVYKYRAEDSKEAQPLAYNTEKIELLDWGYFWLSETPDVESIGWNGKHYRGVTWGKLKVKETGKTFLYYSTHMTGSDVAVIGSAKLIYKHALDNGGFKDLPVFLSGDFNTEPLTNGYNELVKNFVDVNDFLGFDETYTNGGYTAGWGGGTHIIDYVMCSPDNVVPTHYEVLHREYLGGFISDHKGLYVEATLK